ncbi:LysR family transcriptional regulator [Thorsellia anophelis]|uniref:LysR family transcriptional regulator, regulator for metE and metH n=1 Tax=Thorsellia anophelis DSM 18579 TaxID=1123402 RepID=A0A1H9ZAY3_9GAMM|nr:LysR family transcriptional regulator [Thorsellia anophelis]SES78230.1 LysR family transcriptional regulator, regulator for metE and metH [Thorsellia anophelis DSM 18579]
MIERMHLRILREIERQGSLTAAAESLHLTQSALSHTIKRLEQQIGISIWVKEGRKLKLTAAGEMLLTQSKRLLPQLERIDESLTQFATGKQGVLRIGLECHPCFEWLMKIIHPFLIAWQDVDIDVNHAAQFAGLNALLRHEIDLLVTPDPIKRPSLNFEPIKHYEQKLFMHKDNPLAQKEFIEPIDLTGQTLFTYPVGIERLDVFTQFLIPAHCFPKRHKTLEATEMIIQMIQANRGVSAFPSWLEEWMGTDKSIVSRRLGIKGIIKTIYIGIREEDNMHPYISAFIRTALASN